MREVTSYELKKMEGGAARRPTSFKA